MSDLIERRAAIDAVEKESQVDGAYGYMDTKSIVDLIMDLPSAQQWIPVSERLPGYGEQVVANFRNEQISRNRIGVSYCYVQKEGFFSDVPFEYKVVAWMPLPDPWKEEEG